MFALVNGNRIIESRIPEEIKRDSLAIKRSHVGDVARADTVIIVDFVSRRVEERIEFRLDRRRPLRRRNFSENLVVGSRLHFEGIIKFEVDDWRGAIASQQHTFFGMLYDRWLRAIEFGDFDGDPEVESACFSRPIDSDAGNKYSLIDGEAERTIGEMVWKLIVVAGESLHRQQLFLKALQTPGSSGEMQPASHSWPGAEVAQQRLQDLVFEDAFAGHLRCQLFFSHEWESNQIDGFTERLP